METIKKMMKNDENGQLSYGIYSSPAAARSPLQGWVGDRCRDRSIFKIYIYYQLRVQAFMLDMKIMIFHD